MYVHQGFIQDFLLGRGKKDHASQHLIISLNRSHLVMHIAILQRSEPSHSIIIIYNFWGGNPGAPLPLYETLCIHALQT